jgi:hypothetical protein
VRSAPPCELSNGGVICSEVLEVRASGSRPSQGFVKCRTTTLNQVEPVQVLVMNLLVHAPAPVMRYFKSWTNLSIQ